MKRILFVFIFFNYSFSFESHLYSLLKNMHYVGFDNSMNINIARHNLVQCNMAEAATRYRLYKLIYNKNNTLKVKPSVVPKISKIIHQIWLGGNLPFKYMEITNKWKSLHPGWGYKLWNDSNIKELFPLYNQKYFDESNNLAEKADILRLEVLYRFGGIYVDVDYECAKSFDTLAHCYTFFAGVEPLDASAFYIGNAIIGSSAGHSILKHCIENIKLHRHEKTIPKRTGPARLTESFCAMSKDLNDLVIAFPATYLYPLAYSLRHNKLSKDYYLKKESLGVHYWTGSWK